MISNLVNFELLRGLPVLISAQSLYIPSYDVTTYGEMSTEEEESMAEGVVENLPSSRYFCHVCNREISPNLPVRTKQHTVCL